MENKNKEAMEEAQKVQQQLNKDTTKTDSKEIESLNKLQDKQKQTQELIKELDKIQQAKDKTDRERKNLEEAKEDLKKRLDMETDNNKKQSLRKEIAEIERKEKNMQENRRRS